MLWCILAVVLVPLAYVGLVLWRLRRLEGELRALPQPPPSRPGIWMMGHRVHPKVPLQHLFLRITPSDERCLIERADLFCLRDAAGRAFCTVSAGPVDGKLVLAFNRRQDQIDPISFEEALPLAGPDAEQKAIAAILKRAAQYPNHLPFSNWTRITGRGYNCNSLMASLVRDCGLPWPRFVRYHMVAVGWRQRVPAKEFRED